MSGHGELWYSDSRGRKQTREVNFAVNIQDFEGMAGYPYLLIAANPQLTIRELKIWLDGQVAGSQRPVNWLQKRRWMFRPDDADREPGRSPDRDGREDLAIQVMAEFCTSSARDLVKILAENGVKRSREWVRRNRTRGLHPDN